VAAYPFKIQETHEIKVDYSYIDEIVIFKISILIKLIFYIHC